MEESHHNYGKVLSVWDQVFGTFYLPKQKQLELVGIEGQSPVPNSFWGQLRYPFRMKTHAEELEK